jgi:hypothetical protein
MDEQKRQQQNNGPNRGEFESDTQKLVHRHLSDPDHKITDEELARVRVGMSPGPDEPTQKAIEEAEKRIADRKSIRDDETLPGAQKITPWDLTT